MLLSAATADTNLAHNFFGDFSLVLVFAALASILCRPLRLPPLFGYLLAGVIIGPHTPIPVFADPERVHALSEFGVVLVMFCVGLEFTLGKFVRGLPTAGGVALVEVALMGWLGFVVARAFGMAGVEAAFVGACIAISSTMVVSRMFERDPPEDDLRELVLSTLVLQDVVAIVLLTLMGAVAAGAGLEASAIARTLAQLSLFLVSLVVAGLWVVPRVVAFVEAQSSAETRTVFALGLCFGLGLLAVELGYSGALGAFAAGVLVAESGLGHRYERQVQPVQHLFVAVFFVSVGMTFDPAAVAANPWFTLALCLAISVGQLLFVTIGGVLSGSGLRRSIMAGLALGQIGEFGFILAAVGTTGGVLPAWVLPCLVAAAVLTSLVSPFAFSRRRGAAGGLAQLVPARIRTALSLYESWIETLRERSPGRRTGVRKTVAVLVLDLVALAGIAVAEWALHPWLESFATEQLGLNTRWAALLHEGMVLLASLPFVVGAVRSTGRLARQLAELVLGQASSRGPDLSGASRRAFVVVVRLAVLTVGLVLMLSLTQALAVSRGGVILLAVVVLSMLPSLWRDCGDLDGHARAGADAVLELMRPHPHANQAHANFAIAGHPAASSPSNPAPSNPAVDALLGGLGHVEVVTLPADFPAEGRTLAQLELPKHSGAVVLRVGRGDGQAEDPGAATRVGPEDQLVLAGGRNAVERAREHLMGFAEAGATS